MSYNDIFKMCQNILEQYGEQPLNASVKINFLTRQKQHMSQLIKDLNENMRINKKIINQLSKSIQTNVTETRKLRKFNEIVQQLNKQNQRLAQRNQNLFQQLETLKCNILIHDQIKQEQQFEYYTVIRQYQDKILQLRRAIQDKQYMIQEKQTQNCKHDQKKRQSTADPKHECMRLMVQIDELKQLTKRLSKQNNELRKKNIQLQQSNLVKDKKIDRIEGLLKSETNFQLLKNLYNSQKRSMSGQKICFNIDFKRQDQKSKVRQETLSSSNASLVKKKNNKSSNNSNDIYYIKNETITSLRQCLFKQKLNSQMLLKKLSQLNNNYNSILNTNKLLTQSNINYQQKRSKLQSQLNYYKKKNQQLLSIIMNKKIRLSKSLQKNPTQLVLKSIKIDPQIVYNHQDNTKALESMKQQIQQLTKSLSKVITRNYFKSLKTKNKKYHSFSCATDYLPKLQLDSVQQFIKKQQLKTLLRRNQQKQKDQSPFIADFSIIKPEKAPISFADYKNSFKKKKVSESFIQISQEILKF